MAKQVRIKLNSKGIVDLLKSAEVESDLTARGHRIAAAAGDGHEVTVVQSKDRAGVFVTTETTEARTAEAEGRALTRAIDAGR